MSEEIKPDELYPFELACKLMGFHPQTVRLWDKKGTIRIVRTPGGRRRVPGSEILRIREMMKVPEAPVVSFKPPKPEVEKPKPLEALPRPTEEAPAPAPIPPTPPRELPRHAMIEKLLPSNIVERKNYGELLTASIALKRFTAGDLSKYFGSASYPQDVINKFLERMTEQGFLERSGDSYELKVRVMG